MTITIKSAEMTFDLLIRNGTIVDGSGNAAFAGDVGISGDRVAAIGTLRETPAHEVIDATGQVVCPGFIDIHSHSDFTLPVDGRAESKVHQGVTTEVVGMCGISPAPLVKERRGELLEYASFLHPLFQWQWHSFGEFYDRLQGTLSVNLAPVVGHGTLRVAAMGFARRPPGPDEAQRMQQLLEAALDAGAFGMSTGLIYPPGSFAATAELIDLARALAPRGALYFSHIRSEGARLLKAIDEAIEIGIQAQVPVQIAHFKAAGEKNWPKAVPAIERVEKARQQGLDVSADMYPYPASSTGLGALLPDDVFSAGVERVLRQLEDPAARGELSRLLPERDYATVLLANCPGAKELEGQSIAEVASTWQTSPQQAVLQVLRLTSCQSTMISFGMSEENLKLNLAQPWMSIGSDGYALSPSGPLGQGKPHPRSYGTFPRVLQRYVREEKVLTLEQAIHRMTTLPANRLRLWDRGRLIAGVCADVVVFDPAQIQEQSTFVAPHRFPLGISTVLVNGKPVIREGHHTGRRPGQVLTRLEG